MATAPNSAGTSPEKGGPKTSRKKAEANRRNAQKSTGPKTDEGKARVRGNAFKHGLTGRTVALPGEDQEALAQSRQRLHAQRQPDGEEECLLVDLMAECMLWLSRSSRIGVEILTYYHREATRRQARRTLKRPETDPIASALLDYLTCAREDVARKITLAEEKLRAEEEQRTAKEPEEEVNAGVSERSAQQRSILEEIFAPDLDLEGGRVLAVAAMEDMFAGWDAEGVTVGEAFLADATSANALTNLSRYETSKWHIYLNAARRLDELQANRVEQAT